MLIKMAGYESTSIDGLPMQGCPKNEELTSSNPILTIGSRKDMVDSKTLEVTKHRITDARSLSRSLLIPPPRTGESSLETLGVIVRMGGDNSTKRWQT